ncbi:MAG: thiol reductant ABC exporter subunit CydC [Propionibacteriaceae bacterium]
MKKVWLRVRSWRLILAIMLAACASGASVALLGVSGWLIARASEHPPLMYLNVAVVGVRFFGISRGVFRYSERLVGHDVALRQQSAMREETYRALSQTTLLGRRRGDLLSRVVSDVDAILDLVVRVILPFASASLVVLGSAIIVACFHPLDAALLLCCLLVAGIVVPYLAQRASARADANVAPVRGRYAATVHELNRAVADLVAYDADLSMQEQLAAIDRELADAEQRSAKVRGIAEAGQLIAIGVCVIAGTALGARAASQGRVEPRMIAVLALLPLALHEVLGDLARAAQTATKALAALARVDAIIAAPPVGTGDRPADATAQVAGKISAHQLAAGWPDAEPVVRDLTFDVRPGDRVALVGPSGVGKTTVAATILGLIPAQDGTIDVDGRVGYLAQDAHIFSTTVAENVRIGNKDASDAEISEALAKAGIPNLELDRLIGETGAPLSGGENRRVALARLLVGRFDTFILDEPTEHIDGETAAALMADLWAAIGDAPALVITHDSGLMAQCSRTVRLA